MGSGVPWPLSLCPGDTRARTGMSREDFSLAHMARALCWLPEELWRGDWDWECAALVSMGIPVPTGEVSRELLYDQDLFALGK